MQPVSQRAPSLAPNNSSALPSQVCNLTLLVRTRSPNILAWTDCYPRYAADIYKLTYHDNKICSDCHDLGLAAVRPKNDSIVLLFPAGGGRLFLPTPSFAFFP